MEKMVKKMRLKFKDESDSIQERFDSIEQKFK
jgi:hypothetical protein